MRRNSTIIVVAVVALVVGAGLAAAVGNVPAATQTESNDGQTITVGASGSAETTPDQAILEVAVVTTGDSAGAVRQQLANNVSRMRAALSEAGVADDQIRTVRYDIRRNHERRQKEEAPEYRAMHSFRITLNDTDRVGELIDVAVENGATEVDEVRFGLSTDAQRETRKEALEDAMANARGQADTLATAGNLEVTGVHAVSTVERGYRPQVEHATAMAAGDSGTAVESGPVSVTVEVQVTYNATNA